MKVSFNAQNASNTYNYRNCKEKNNISFGTKALDAIGLLDRYKVGENSYVVMFRPVLRDCKIMKENGIERIVDTCENIGFKDSVEKSGLEYNSIKLFDKDIFLTTHPMFNTNDRLKVFKTRAINKLKQNLIEILNLTKKDNTVVCTNFCTIIDPWGRTSFLQDLISAFNKKDFSKMAISTRLYMEDFYQTLNAGDKKLLGLTTDVDGLILKNLKDY